MARQAIASSEDMQRFSVSFTERLQGLARSHDLLVGNNWSGVCLKELVRAQVLIADRSDAAAIAIEGPELMLSPASTQTIGLALHELVTNALKHGALSRPGGTVNVTWRVSDAKQPHIHLEWREVFENATSPPTRSGFGRKVLERIVPTSLNGTVKLEFRSEGVRWVLDAPLASIQMDN